MAKWFVRLVKIMMVEVLVHITVVFLNPRVPSNWSKSRMKPAWHAISRVRLRSAGAREFGRLVFYWHCAPLGRRSGHPTEPRAWIVAANNNRYSLWRNRLVRRIWAFNFVNSMNTSAQIQVHCFVIGYTISLVWKCSNYVDRVKKLV